MSARQDDQPWPVVLLLLLVAVGLLCLVWWLQTDERTACLADGGDWVWDHLRKQFRCER